MPSTDLTELETALVDHLVEHGGSVRAAAEAIGHSHSACVVAMKRERVVAAMEAALRSAVMPLAVQALRLKGTLMEHAKSESVRNQAASDVLDRALPKRVTERHEVVGDVRITFDLTPPDARVPAVTGSVTTHTQAGDVAAEVPQLPAPSRPAEEAE